MVLSIIVPVFNEEKTVATVLDRLGRLEIPRVEKDIIVVNDGSTDRTGEIITASIKNKKNFSYISHTHNQGKGASVRDGIQIAQGEYIIIQDADLEYNPSDIKKLVEQLEKHPGKAIFGTRLKRLPHLFQEESRPQFFIHFIGNRILSLLTSILYGQWITDMETCYKLFPSAIAKRMHLKSKGFELEPELTAKLLKNGVKIVEIPIVASPRGYEEGKKLHTIRDGWRALCMLIACRLSD